MSNYTPQRSVLYVPAGNQRAIDKSASIDADWIIFDLEDSVGIDNKADARAALVNAFTARQFGHSHAAIRCNAVESNEFLADITAIAACCPDAVLLPKVSAAGDVQLFSEQAAAAGLSENTKSWFMVETAGGLVNLDKIIRSAAEIPWSLSTLVVGHNDIASETGVSLEHDRRYMIPWLMQVVLHAKQAELQVLDSVWNNFRDLVGFEKEARQAKDMGFDGKTLIHPAQVEPATRLFSPTDDEIARAMLIVNTFAQPEHQQSNVLAIEGEMVERLHLQQAQRLLDKAGISIKT